MLSTKEVGSILSSAKDQPDGGPHHTNTFGRTSPKLPGRGQSLRGVNGDNDEDFVNEQHQCPSIEPSHINGLIDLIKNNYTSLSESQPQSLDGTNSTDHLGSLLKFFQGSLDYVQTKSNSNTDSSIAYGQLKLDSSITPSSIVQNDNIDEVAEIDKPIEKEEDVELATSNEDQNEHIPTRSVDQIVNGIPSSDTIDSELSDPKELFATFLATIRLLVKWR